MLWELKDMKIEFKKQKKDSETSLITVQCTLSFIKFDHKRRDNGTSCKCFLYFWYCCAGYHNIGSVFCTLLLCLVKSTLARHKRDPVHCRSFSLLRKRRLDEHSVTFSYTCETGAFVITNHNSSDRSTLAWQVEALAQLCTLSFIKYALQTPR